MFNKSLTTFLLTGLLALNVATKASPDTLKIADFNGSTQNALDGYFNKFEKNPSKATVGLTRSVFFGDNGKSFIIKAKRDENGFCGAWMHFFDFRADDKELLDASDYGYLSFWVKGEEGGEDFTVKLADERLIGIEDSMKVSGINDLLPDGVTQEWQEVLVPLTQLPRIDITKLGGITFDFETPGDYIVYIDDMVLKKNKDSIFSPAETSEVSEATPLQTRENLPRTLWAWEVFEILENKNNKQDKVFELCKRENVDRLWLQLPIRYEPDVDLSANAKDIVQPDNFKVSLLHEKKLRKFIRKAHKRGIKIEALEGYPEFAQKPYHFIPLAIVDAVIDYNNRVKPEERFAGVHFDNEPYLIIGWNDKERRERILQEFMELNVECQRRIHENSDMVYGVDVPFWWNAPDALWGGAIGDVTFNGERKPAVFFCIDLLDNIGIMNYRDTAHGADGITTHAKPILEYAGKTGKDDVYIGLEIFRYKPTEVYFPFGLPRDAFYKALQTDAEKFGYLSRINAFRTQLIDDGVNVHIGIEIPADPDDAMQAKINDTLAEMSRHLSVNKYKNTSAQSINRMEPLVQQKIEKDLSWEDYKPIDIIDTENLQLYSGFKATSIMLGKTTFADESYSTFKKELSTAESELLKFPAYRGTAIHYLKVLDEKFRE